MKRGLTVLFLSLSIILISVGCSKSVSGVFITEKSSLSYLELKSDGSFYVLKDLAYEGRYKIDGQSITFTLPSGLSVNGTIANDVLIDPEGDTWVKK